MDRQTQFRTREALIFEVANELLLENGDTGMTLDDLAAALDLAKGTLYKHFQSKDELYMLLLIRHEKLLLEMILDHERSFEEHLTFHMLHHLYHSAQTVLFHQIEERLSSSGHALNRLFQDLYAIRRQRLRRIIEVTDQYLKAQQSHMSTRNYLAAIWALTQGGAAMLNSSFYQRYLGSRDTLRVAYIDQALALPTLNIDQVTGVNS